MLRRQARAGSLTVKTVAPVELLTHDERSKGLVGYGRKALKPTQCEGANKDVLHRIVTQV